MDAERYRWLFRNCPAYLSSIDTDGRYVDLSDAFLTRLGYAREELIGERSHDHMSADCARRLSEEYLPRFPNEARLHFLLARRARNSGDNAMAKALAAEALALNSANLEIQCLYHELLQSDDATDAREDVTCLD